MNLKKLLMDLGNKLVMNHGFTPAAMYRIPVADKTTVPVAALTEFINLNPEAQTVLDELDVEWDLAKAQQSETSNEVKDALKLELVQRLGSVMRVKNGQYSMDDAVLISGICAYFLQDYAELLPPNFRERHIKEAELAILELQTEGLKNG